MSRRAEPSRKSQCQAEAQDRHERSNHVDDVHRAGDRLSQAGELAGIEHLTRRRLHQPVDRIAGFRQLAMDAEIDDRPEHRGTNR